jgi:hypothetical protein
MPVEPIKIALIAEGEYLPAWQYLMLERLLGMTGITLVAVVLRGEALPGWSSRLTGYLLAALHWLDARLFRHPRQAQQPRSFLDLLGDVTVCMAGSQRYRQLVRASRVDVVVDLTNGDLLPETLAWARQGVWRHFCGKSACHTWQTLAVAEYATRQDEFLSGVERFVGGYVGAECLWQAGSSVDQVSLSRSLEPALWKMADFVPQCLTRLANHISPGCQGYATEILLSDGGICKPGVPVLLKALTRYPVFLLRKLCQKLSGFEQQWILLLGDQRRRLPEVLELDGFRCLQPPPDRFWADPMLVEHTGETWLFFEEFLYAQGKGHLACMRLHEDGQYSPPSTILERPYHLSYPFVFQWQGQYYLIPESAENHTLELYRCETFPHQWVFEKNLMENVDAYDATLLEHDGRWWMFVNMRRHPGESPHETLYLFHADNPLSSEWQPHPQNPVIASAATARPAGPLVMEGEVLYRPSQHCAGWYGRGINLNVVVQLDMEVYREEPVMRRVCTQGGQYRGLHTLALGHGLTVLDAIRPVYRSRLGQWMAGWCDA